MKVSTQDHRTPRSPCPYCGVPLDVATGVPDDTPPEPGAVGICASCAKVHVFTETLEKRKPTDEEQAEIDASKEVARARLLVLVSHL